MMIEVKKLVKSFDGFRALDALDINVPRGAVYGLVGPNGAGKSTAIRHLAGIYRQDSGEVLMSCQISASLPFHISSAEFKLSTIQFPLPIQNHLLREEIRGAV